MKRNLHVLLADDERLARESMRDYLPWEQMGMETPVCVENGALALDYLCSNPVDIFIMDIRMPVMDGMALLEEIKKRNLDVLIIVLSAYDQFDYAQKAIQSRKVFEYVLKPIRRRAFCEVLEKAAAQVLSHYDAIADQNLTEILTKMKKTYVAEIRHHQMDDAFLCLQNNKSKLADYQDQIEELRRFFVSLYVETQMVILEQSDLAWEKDRRFGAEGLRTLSECGSAEELWSQFYYLVNELRPYLECGFGSAEKTKASAVMEQCLEEIQRHYEETDFSLYQLAEIMQMNANYLSTRFKSEVGVGFVNYVNALRVQKAQHLLKDMRYRTNEVSMMVGFDNPRYFTRVFKKATGLAPSEYRSRLKNYENR